MKLDFTSFENALKSLAKAVERSAQDLKDEEVRDAVIQRFEYTYELCWKMLKRQLEQEVPNPGEIDQLAYRDLLRLAAERGIFEKIEPWMEYRTQRNITAHTYDRKKAESVYQSAVRFLPDAQQLLESLKKRSL